MVPIHETDLAHERWTKAGWDNYELWEKVELRLRRKKQLWIFSTAIIFMALSAVPIVSDRWPKWTSRSILRHLAQEINWVKREAGINRAAYRISFVEPGKFNFVVERLTNCALPRGEVVRSGTLASGNRGMAYMWVSNSQGSELGVPGLVSDFCYDSLDGSQFIKKGEPIAGFGVVPVRDLTEKRLDRMSILLLMGPSAEISFD